MTRIKFALGLLCTYAAYYSAIFFSDCQRQKNAKNSIKETPEPPVNVTKPETFQQYLKERKSVLVHDTVLRSLFAYDNSDHKSMVHFRFDANTVDLLNKFKMATGVDNTKFVAFAVKYLFETHPELKTIIKQFIQNTEL